MDLSENKEFSIQDLVYSIKLMDTNEDSSLNFAEWQAWDSLTLGTEKEDKFSFKFVDADGNKSITVAEIQAFMRDHADHNLTVDQILAAMKDYDTNQDSQINFEEWRKWMAS